jgi:hypothetical protein
MELIINNIKLFAIARAVKFYLHTHERKIK